MIFVSVIICRLLWNCKYLKWVSHVCWASPGHKMSCDDNFVKISQFLQFPPKVAPIGDRDFLKIRAEGEGRSHQYYENDTPGQCLLPLLYLFYWLARANFERMRGFWRYFWLTQFFKNISDDWGDLRSGDENAKSVALTMRAGNWYGIEASEQISGEQERRRASFQVFLSLSSAAFDAIFVALEKILLMPPL